MSVLLPAPLAPTRPTIPGATSSVSPSSATTPGNRLVSASTRISGGRVPGVGSAMDPHGSGASRRYHQRRSPNRPSPPSSQQRKWRTVSQPTERTRSGPE